MENIKVSVSNPVDGLSFHHFLLTVKNNELNTPSKRLFLLLDNSGSMGLENRLDLVLHLSKSIVTSSNENIEISIFTFSSNCVKINDLKKMDSNNKNQILNMIPQIIANGGTNLLNGLKYILDYIKSIPNPNLIDTHCLLFTDGEPDNKNINEYIGLLNSYFQDSSFNCIIDVFGFGNNLSLDILKIIYTTGKGVFCYVSDINMMATIFNNYLANLFNTVFNQVEISYEIENPITGDIHFNTIYVGNLLSSQERNFIIEIPHNTKLGYFNIKYNDLVNHTKSSKIIQNIEFQEIEFEKYYLHKYRFNLIDILKNIDNNTINNLRLLYSKMKEDMGILSENEYKNDIKILIEDITSFDQNKGQIEKAIQNFNGWGKYYLISIYQAHLNQITINFKDESIQKYSGNFVKNMVSSLDNIFNSITFVTTNYGRNQYNNAPVSASSFNDRYAGCFSGSSKIKIYNQNTNNYDTIYLKEIKSGDILYYSTEYTLFVEYILKTKYVDQRLHKYINQENKDYIIGTSNHPIYENNKWIYLKDSIYSKKISPDYYDVEYLYNISVVKITSDNIISNFPYFELNDLKCSTFGHGYLNNNTSDNVLSSTFWGKTILNIFHQLRNDNLLVNNILTLDNNYDIIRDHNSWVSSLIINGIEY